MLTQVHMTLIYCMTPVIWLVQLVQYPAFRYVDPDQFIEFHRHHSNWITTIVGPLMLADLGTAFWLVYEKPSSAFLLVNLASIIAIFLSTFLVSVPIHEKLSLGFNRKAIDKLITTNWIRTFLYSLRCLAWMYFYFSPSIPNG